MNGVRHYRIQLGLPRSRLAELADVSITTIAAMEQMHEPYGIYTYNYMKVREVLGAPLDELVRDDYSDREDAGYASVPRESQTENHDNCISVYRNMKKLSFQKLAERLGATSRECGRLACAASEPLEKHIRALAEYEGIWAKDFIKLYSPKREETA